MTGRTPGEHRAIDREPAQIVETLFTVYRLRCTFTAGAMLSDAAKPPHPAGLV